MFILEPRTRDTLSLNASRGVFVYKCTCGTTLMYSRHSFKNVRWLCSKNYSKSSGQSYSFNMEVPSADTMLFTPPTMQAHIPLEVLKDVSKSPYFI